MSMSGRVSNIDDKLRFLGSLSDFDPAKHTVPTDQLAEIDRYMLGKLTETVKEVEKFYGISTVHLYLK